MADYFIWLREDLIVKGVTSWMRQTKDFTLANARQYYSPQGVLCMCVS